MGLMEVNLTIGVITSALTDWVTIFYILSTAPSRVVRSTYKKQKKSITSQLERKSAMRVKEAILNKHVL